MRAVVQRVSRAAVSVSGETVGEIGRGLLVFLGVTHGDDIGDLEYMAGKLGGLRIFEDENSKMNLCLEESGGEILCISQFTLYGDCRKGRRPGFSAAAPPEVAEKMYNDLCSYLKEKGFRVATGRFGATMQVTAHNDGPVTILLDSQKLF